MLKTAMMAGLALLGIGSAQAATVTGDSAGLLTGGFATQLESWLGAGALSLNGIYTRPASGATGSDFHAAVDSMGPTFVVMSATVTSGGSGTFIIGGYDPLSWFSGTGYNNVTAAQATAFLFNLTTTQELMEIPSGIGTIQTYDRSDVGPIFGYGNDLQAQYLYSGSAFSDSYGSGYGQINVLGFGSSTFFAVNALEVFATSAQATAVPEPMTLGLLATGIAGLGVLRRRR